MKTAETTSALSVDQIEAIWYAARVLDYPEIEAVVVTEMTPEMTICGIKYLASGEYTVAKNARPGARRHAKKSYVQRVFIVTRGRGESYEIEAI